MKVYPKPPRKKRTKKIVKSSDEQCNNKIKTETDTPATSAIKNTKLEDMEIEIQEPATVDGQHFIIDDNITVESNIEIEFITSDEIIPSEMNAGAIEYGNSDKKYESVDDVSSQQVADEDDNYDGGNEPWDNVCGT